MTLLAGDLGGTKTLLALCSDDGEPLVVSRFDSHAYDGLAAMVQAFLAGQAGLVAERGRPQRAAFGVAGPITDLPDGQTEVARHASIILGNDEGLGRATALRLTGVAQEPVVQRRLAAIKTFQPMLRGQRLRCAQRHFVSQGALRANRSRKPSLACSGRSSRSIRAWYWLPETMNNR